jgi:hypothetical protein
MNNTKKSLFSVLAAGSIALFTVTAFADETAPTSHQPQVTQPAQKKLAQSAKHKHRATAKVAGHMAKKAHKAKTMTPPADATTPAPATK